MPRAAHPDARPANFAELGALLLRAAPRTVLIDLDLRTGRDAKVQIEFAVEILQCPWPSMKPGSTVLPRDIDHCRAGRNRNLAAPADRLESSAFNDDDGIFDRRASGAINQRAAF